MLLGLGMIHSHFVASEGVDGWYTTVEENEVIQFALQLNCVEIFAKDEQLKIKFNNDTGIMYIPPNTSDGISGLPVNRIIVVGPIGTVVKWRGLVSINNT